MAKEKEHKEIEELQKLAPTLAKLKKTGSYSAPDGYFKTLQEKVAEEIASDGGEVVSINNYRRTMVAAAAVAALFVIGLGLFNTVSEPEGEHVAISEIEIISPMEQLKIEDHFYGINEEDDYEIEIEVEEVANYIAYEALDDYTEQDLILALVEIDEPLADVEFDQTEQDEIIDYLMMEGVDLDFIISGL